MWKSKYRDALKMIPQSKYTNFIGIKVFQGDIFIFYLYAIGYFLTQPLFFSKLISQNHNLWQVFFSQMVLKVQTEIYFIMFVDVTSFHQSQDKKLIITFFKNGPPYPTSQSFKFWHHLDFCSLKEGVSINWNSINSQLKKVFTGFETSLHPLHFLFSLYVCAYKMDGQNCYL